MPKISVFALGALIVVLLVSSFAVFTVSEKEFAVKFRLGEIRRTDYKPGLHFMIPMINNVKKFDKRIMTLDMDPERFLTIEKKNVIVDSFVKWRIY
ncbi:MAG: SPFH domain-containing protein, partial [Gammaproteobacteria bacterium]